MRTQLRSFILTAASGLLLAAIVGACAAGSDEPSDSPEATGGAAQGGAAGSGNAAGTGGSSNAGTGGSSNAGSGGASNAGSGGSAGTTGGSSGSATGGASGGSGGSGGSAGQSGGDVDTCPGEVITLTGSGNDVRKGSAQGDTTSLSADYIGKCASATDDKGKDAVYSFTADVDGRAHVDLGGETVTTFDTILYARSTCDDQSAEVACDDVNAKGSETLDFEVQNGKTYYIIVDGYLSNAGPYRVNVTIQPKGCGDGVKDTGEECDDGNQIDNDACHNNCTINPNPAGDNCANPVIMQLNGTGKQDRVGVVTGDITNFASDYEAKDECDGYTYESGSNDAVVAIKSDVDGTMKLELSGYENPLMYVRSDCESSTSELSCDYNYSKTDPATLELPVAANTTYYVVVDGYHNATIGPFTLKATIKPAYCGNGTTEGSEQCDDGNQNDNDSCHNDCTINPVNDSDVCPGVKLNLVQTGNLYVASVSGTTAGMTPVYEGTCGVSPEKAPDQVYELVSPINGEVTVEMDPNKTNWDTVLYVRKGACEGAGSIQVECDDDGKSNEKITFNAIANQSYWIFVDGYSATKSGPFAFTVDVSPTCGNGKLDPGEECDDSNDTTGDGCNACQVEPACKLSGTAEEPNDLGNFKTVPASCKTFLVEHASTGNTTSSGDADYFDLGVLSSGNKVHATAFVGTTGSCGSYTSTPLVVSIWQASDINAGLANFLGCSKQTGALACKDKTATDGNCNELSYTIGSNDTEHTVIKVHGYDTQTVISDYSLLIER